MDYFELCDFIRNVIDLYNYDKENGIDYSLEEYIARSLCINRINCSDFVVKECLYES